GALSRGERLRALEHAAPHTESQGAVRHPDAEGRVRPIHRGIGLHEGSAGENRASLRDFFEVDAKHIVLATLHALAGEKSGEKKDEVVSAKLLEKAIRD